MITEVQSIFATPTPYSLLPTPYSLLPTPYSLLPQITRRGVR
ncbi:hypothetical protein BJP36_36560 [Moorena producens JHB]|uniref:Uncharacterized protein n=1 Tax=Moorena producens (strain JHB) TaxID=1454205 RepID=A0A9Q9STY2_MOOP1|nr:hypothetical protein [Moorena producens]WAN69607.1 hypothetical protein BJP36_36560 [Moorena producens JHB]